MFIYQGSVITNFLSQNGQQYKIPVYQRNYEWTKEQCKKLFEDIVQAAKRNQLHFTGSIVFQPLAPIKGIGNNILIDGQQRLTTIYILIKALVDSAQNDNEKALPLAALFNVDQFNQFNLDDTTKVKLKPAKDNNDQLLHLLYDEHDKITNKDCEIYRNYEYFCELIEEQQNKGVSINDIYRGIGLLTVAIIQLDGNDKAQEIFERINSTGMPLSLADKIRNYVLMVDANQDSLYDNYWLKIERLLPKEQLQWFFLDYLNLKIEGFANKENAYDVFKAHYNDGKYTNESILKEILYYSELYHTFLYGDDKYGKNVNSLLKSLQRLKQTTVFLFLFRIFDDYNNKVITQNELEKVLRFLLNYSIRRLICEVGSNSLRGLYKTLYSRVFVSEENKKAYYDSIVSFFLQLTSKDVLPNDEVFSKALKENNLYRKNALCKYLLTSIENQGKEQLVTENLTIEHILPQNKNLSPAWQKMIGIDNWKEVQEKYLHTLGNLTLTGYNSELGDKPFEAKQKDLDDVKTKVVILYSDVKGKTVWNAEAIESRADRLTEIIKKLYPIEMPEKTITFTTPGYQEYTTENPDNATFKTPNYYVLQGERVKVTNFTEMLRSVIGKLYDLDKSIIEELARNNEQLISWSQNIMFSYDKNKVYGNYNIENTKIYAGTGFSALFTIQVIRSLLERYDIDVEDFVYSARDQRENNN